LDLRNLKDNESSSEEDQEENYNGNINKLRRKETFYTASRVESLIGEFNPLESSVDRLIYWNIFERPIQERRIKQADVDKVTNSLITSFGLVNRPKKDDG